MTQNKPTAAEEIENVRREAKERLARIERGNAYVEREVEEFDARTGGWLTDWRERRAEE